MSHATPGRVSLDPRFAPPFPEAALIMLRNPQLRKNVGHAIDVIQAKRGNSSLKKPIGRSCVRRHRPSVSMCSTIWAHTSSSSKPAAPLPEDTFTGPPTPLKRAKSSSTFSARKTPPRSSRSRP